jgi:cell division protein FtsB
VTTEMIVTEEAKVPSWRLKAEADKRRATEAALTWLAAENVQLEREIEDLRAKLEAVLAEPLLP